MAYTLADFIKLNPGWQKRYDPKTSVGYLTNAQTGREISFPREQGSQYGLGKVIGGSHEISDPGRFIKALTEITSTPSAPSSIASKPAQPAYQSPYTEQIGQTLAAMQQRPAFSYTPAADVGLQAAQESAMDAVSRAAARRGMMYSAGNKAQMGQTALQLVPQFEQAAYNRYAQQGQDAYSQLAALQGLESQAYGRYRDVTGDVRQQEETDYSRLIQQMQLDAAREAGIRESEAGRAAAEWEQYKWGNLSPAEQQKMAAQQEFDWQKAILQYQHPTMGQSIEAEKWAREYPLKAAQTQYNVNKPYPPESTFDPEITNAAIAKLYKFYNSALANHYIEKNARSWANSGVDMNAVMKAFKAKWPDYRAGDK